MSRPERAAAGRAPTAVPAEGTLRAPPDFREELHPEEIVRRPSRHPWLATLAIVVCTVTIAMLLRALDTLGRDGPARADGPGAVQRAGAPLAGGADAKEAERTVAREGR